MSWLDFRFWPWARKKGAADAVANLKALTATDEADPQLRVKDEGANTSLTSLDAKMALNQRDAGNEQVGALTNDAPVAFTADAPGNAINATSHGLVDGRCVYFSTTGTLPAPLKVNTPYFVRNPTANTFQISTTDYSPLGDTPVDITDAGTGSHTYVATGQFIGTFTRIDAFDHFEILYASITAMAAVKKIWSNDGVNPLTGLLAASSLTAIKQSGYNVYYDVNEGRGNGAYYKLKIDNGETDQTPYPGVVGVNWLMRTPYLGAFVTATQGLTQLSRYLLVRGLVKPEPGRHAISADKAITGEVTNLFPYEDFEIEHTGSDPTADYTVTVANGGSVTYDGQGSLVLATGTDINNPGLAQVRSKSTVQYAPGRPLWARKTFLLAAADANLKERHGIVNDADGGNGFFFGQTDGKHQIIYMRAGVETKIDLDSPLRNGDPLDGSQGSAYRDATGTPIVPDFTKRKVGRIVFLWHGNGPCWFEILSPTGEAWVPVHTFTFEDLTGPSLTDPDVFVQFRIEKVAGSATDHSISSSSVVAGRMLPERRAQVSQLNSYVGTVAASGVSPSTVELIRQFPTLHVDFRADQNGTLHVKWYGADGILDKHEQIPYTADTEIRNYYMKAQKPRVQIYFENTSGSIANARLTTTLLPNEGNAASSIRDALTLDTIAIHTKGVVLAEDAVTAGQLNRIRSRVPNDNMEQPGAALEVLGYNSLYDPNSNPANRWVRWPGDTVGGGFVNIKGSIPLDSGEEDGNSLLTPATAYYTSAGTFDLITPGNNKKVELRWIYALNDPASADPARITIKLGAVTLFESFGISKRQKFLGASNAKVTVTIDSPGPVAVSALWREI